MKHSDNIHKETRGGARPNSGRKEPPTKVRLSFTINGVIAGKLKAEKNQSALVEKLLRDHYEM